MSATPHIHTYNEKMNYTAGDCEKDEEETMVDQKVNEATWALIGSFQETSQDIVQRIVAAQECNTKFAQSFFSEGMDILKSSQALAESIAALQERNMKFVQSFFTEGVEMLKSQAESARTMVQELQQKTLEQQEAFQQLAQESTETYLNFLRDPLSAYQRVVEATEASVRQASDASKKNRKSSSQ